MLNHRYLTCDLSNLTASCSVSGGIYRDVLVIPGLTPVPMRSVPPDSIAIGRRSAGLRTRRGDRFGGIEQQTENFDQFKLVDGKRRAIPLVPPLILRAEPVKRRNLLTPQ